MLARGEGEPEPVDLRGRRGEGPGTAHPALGVAGPEPIPVPTVRLEPPHLDVNRVPELGGGHRVAAPDDVPHPLVPGQLPTDLDPLGGEPAAGLERTGGEPRPEHDPRA